MIGFLFFVLATISLFVGFVFFLIGLLAKSSVLKIISYIAFGGTLLCLFIGIITYGFFSDSDPETPKYAGVYQLDNKGLKLMMRDDYTFFMDSVPGLNVSGSGTWLIDEIDPNPIMLVFDTGESLYCNPYGSFTRSYLLFSYDNEFGIKHQIQDTSLVKEMRFYKLDDYD